MTNVNPTISICMPTFDRPDMLRQTLVTIAGQTYRDFETVIADGCVKHPALASEMGEELWDAARVRSVCQPDNGIFHGVVLALERAKGDVLYFCCDDDGLEGNAALSIVAEAFRGHFASPYWISGKMNLVQSDGETVIRVLGGQTSYENMLQSNYLPQPAVFWNRAMAERVGTFDWGRYKHTADYDLWLRMWQVCPPIFINEIVGKMRRHPAQNTQVNLGPQKAEARAIRAHYKSGALVIEWVKTARWLGSRILAKTIPAVFRGSGAT